MLRESSGRFAHSTAKISLLLAAMTLSTAALCASEDAAELDEIVITANKTQEPASKVPISVLAYSDEALKQSGIKSIADLGNLAPGLQFDQTAGLGGGATTYLSIRGVSSQIGSATTGVYLDDVAIQTRIGPLSYFGNPYPTMYDLERVEVLRGPQGTLFGAGAEGGAIRFISREPSLNDYSGNARAELAMTDGGAPSGEVGFAAGGPVVKDEIGFRLSVWGRKDGGYIDRIDPITGSVVDRDANTNSTSAARLAFLFSPISEVKITPSFYAQAAHSSDTSSYYLTQPNSYTGEYANGRLIAQPGNDRLYVASLKVEANLAHDLQLTSVSAYVVRDGDGLQDSTAVMGTVLGGYGYGVPPGGDPADYPQYWAFPTDHSQLSTDTISTKLHSVSQELRVSNAPDSRLRWTGGLYFSRAVQTDTQSVLDPWGVNNVINPIYGANVSPNDPVLYAEIESTDKQTAAFGQVDYKMAPKWTLTVGGRISHTVAAYVQNQSGFLTTGDNTIQTEEGSQSQNPWSGKLALAYQITPDDMIYASAGRGFRMGGANQAINSAPESEGGCGVTAPPTYGTDTVNSYEVGVKGRADRLRFDADVFWVQWDNIQEVLSLPCGFAYIANAGDARTRGFDLALRYTINRALTVNLSASYVDAEFTKTVYVPTTTPGDPGSLFVQAGDRVAGEGSAPWSIVGSFDYRFKAAGYDSSLYVEDAYKSHDGGIFPWMHPLSNLYQPMIPSNPATNLLNTRLTTTIGQVGLSAYVNNITNSHEKLYLSQDNGESLLITGIKYRPRTFGLAVDYNF
jgi:outer membrane receptor protein involved in Fe transport